jgi:CRISPR-associated endonuclease/helicase Cas3
MKLSRSFDEIIKDTKNFSDNLKNLSNIYAHSSKIKTYETLYEHSQLVVQYFSTLIKNHNIENVIDNLIIPLSFDDEYIALYIKKLFLDTIIFHDFGKVNDNFQSEKMKNPDFQYDKSVKIGSEHSFLSAYIFINYHFDEIYRNEKFTDKYKNILWCYSFLFSIPIIKHHSSYLAKEYDFDPEKTDSIFRFLELFNFNINNNLTRELIYNEEIIWKFFDNFIKDKNFNFFPLFALLKLNWSLLTAADYYATSEYMNDLKIESFGVIDENLRNAIIQNFSRLKSYNSELLEKSEKYLAVNPDQLDRSPENLNILRQRLGAEVLSNLEKLKDEHIFYIEAPTGAGKTNLSLIALQKLLKLHPEINKVFYVFPFTTLITQTFKVIKETLGLKDEQIAQVYSKSGFQLNNQSNEEDANYGNLYKNKIDNLFVNYPVTLITHIQFFNILKSNDKKSNYLLHRLANSVVVIDEIQSYNPEHWDKVKYFISNYAQYFNIRFIIMSATLPKLHNISIPENKILKFNDLVNNAQKNYLQNPNFSSRVTIKTDLLENKDITLEKLAEIVYEKSEDFAKNRTDKYKNSVYTIIEFIFKKTATEFFEIIKSKKLFTDYEIFVLSGTIIEPRRKYIIEYLKDSANRSKKILLISTQVVEAGVDIDMDLGFKNQSLIDSDEQLAGRINRNVKKNDCELWLFKYNEPSIIYNKDLRYKIAREIDKEEIKHVLQKKDFNAFYNKVMKEINAKNSSVYKDNFRDYLNNFYSFNFSKIDSDFRLIESDTASIFVPITIPITCYGKETNFSDNEINFLEKNKIYKSGEDEISGEKIWNFYLSLINNMEMDSLLKEIDLKILNGIMSKFVFSVFTNKINDLEEYLEFNEERENYKISAFYKLNYSSVGEDKIYSLERGLNESKLNISFEFL